MHYCNLPGIINERFSSLFSKDHNQISEKEFVETLVQVYAESTVKKMEMIFKMYDFDNDGLIGERDVRLILSYFPK